MYVKIKNVRRGAAFVFREGAPYGRQILTGQVGQDQLRREVTRGRPEAESQKTTVEALEAVQRDGGVDRCEGGGVVGRRPAKRIDLRGARCPDGDCRMDS